MGIAERIRARLEAAFHPDRLEIIDESESHRGHAGFREGGESHFRVVIAAPGFGDMSRLQRHRAVHDALGKDMIASIHALALEISA